MITQNQEIVEFLRRAASDLRSLIVHSPELVGELAAMAARLDNDARDLDPNNTE